MGSRNVFFKFLKFFLAKMKKHSIGKRERDKRQNILTGIRAE
jgi:hypothetical protein